MADLEEVTEKTYRLEVLIPNTLWPSAMYFINVGGGVLVEPGPGTAIPFIQEAMRQIGMKDLAYIIPTHIHLDHGGGIGGLAQLFPQAKVVLHPQAVKHAIDPSRLIESTRMSFGEDFENGYGAILPVLEAQVEIAEDGGTISVDGRKLQIIHAPGHAPHHIAIFDPETGCLFCGEALGLPMPWAKSSPVPAAAPPAFDPEVYQQTIEKLRKLKPRFLCYSHDGVGREPEELIAKVIENTRIYSDMVLNALREGDDIEAIIERFRAYIYDRFGVAVEQIDRVSLEGFIFYFKKNGLV